MLKQANRISPRPRIVSSTQEQPSMKKPWRKSSKAIEPNTAISSSSKRQSSQLKVSRQSKESKRSVSPKPQQLRPIIQGSTVKDVRMRNTKVNTAKTQTPRSNLTTTQKRSTSRSSSKNKIICSVKGPINKETPEISAFCDTFSASEISHTQNEEQNISQSILKYIPTLAPSHKLSISDFQLGRMIDQGQYYEDFIAIQSRNRLLVTIRIIDKNKVAKQQRKKQLIQSIKMHFYLSSLKIPHILQLYGLISDPCYLYLVMEPTHPSLGPNLWNQAIVGDGLDQTLVIHCAQSLVQCISVLHSRSILLRNIDLSNLQMHFGLLKIGILDQACRVKDKRRGSFIGQPQNIPHQLAQNLSYGLSSDLWQLGLCLFSLATGSKPFTGDTPISRILTLDFKMPLRLSGELGALIARLLTKETERVSIETLRGERWMRKGSDCIEREIWLFWG